VLRFAEELLGKIELVRRSEIGAEIERTVSVVLCQIDKPNVTQACFMRRV